jgi:hypothetical protein
MWNIETGGAEALSSPICTITFFSVNSEKNCSDARCCCTTSCVVSAVFDKSRTISLVYQIIIILLCIG